MSNLYISWTGGQNVLRYVLEYGIFIGRIKLP